MFVLLVFACMVLFVVTVAADVACCFCLFLLAWFLFVVYVAAVVD